MILQFSKRMLTEVPFKLLMKFVYNMGWKGMRAISKFKKRLKNDELFPAFLMLSVTNQCNFSCQGCWVSIDNSSKGMDKGTLNNIINSSKNKGSYFFGILGGEPLMYPHIFEIFEEHSDCYFQLFTNGSLLTNDIAQKLRKYGNVSPLISVEGLADVSDIRRGAEKVFNRTMKGIENSTNQGLITGVATSVCKSNFEELVSENFVNQCIEKGVHYLWYYIYRPVGPRPTPELALSEIEILKLRKFIVEIRKKAPIMIIDTYWDKDGVAMCPGALGMSHHINAMGDIEFCPPLQFAIEKVNGAVNVDMLIESSTFLRELRKEIPKKTRGCPILEDPKWLNDQILKLNGIDSSHRNSAFKELQSMQKCAGHHNPGMEIPEQSWVYKFAKKYWFFGFGVYG
jgi:MoaA/NifB/PqqE/SkfB family radical SAM enzyme